MDLCEHQPFEAKTRTLREAIAADLGLPIEQIRPESRFMRDLGIDTFDLLELLEELEDEFGVLLREGDEVSIRTVADLESASRDAQEVAARRFSSNRIEESPESQTH